MTTQHNQPAPYELAEYQSGQWWLKELEAMSVTREVTADMVRAAKVACNFAAAVFGHKPAHPDDVAIERAILARQSTLDGAAQADIAVIEAARRDIIDFLRASNDEDCANRVEEFMTARQIAKNIAAPQEQAAERAALDDDQCDKAAAQAMDRVAKAKDMHALEINPDISTHHALRRELIRAGFALAAPVAEERAPTDAERLNALRQASDRAEAEKRGTLDGAAERAQGAPRAETALRKLCDQLDSMKRRLRHTPGTGQSHSYLLHEDVEAYVEEARKALTGAPQEQAAQERVAVPEGFALVPIAPTHEMVGAGARAQLNADAGNQANSLTMAKVAYDAMLAAAPSPAATVAQEGEHAQVVGDLAMLVRRLVRRLEKDSPGTDLAPQALDYLRRKGLDGSPLRSADQQTSAQEGGAA